MNKAPVRAPDSEATIRSQTDLFLLEPMSIYRTDLLVVCETDPAKYFEAKLFLIRVLSVSVNLETETPKRRRNQIKTKTKIYSLTSWEEISYDNIQNKKMFYTPVRQVASIKCKRKKIRMHHK